MRIIRLAGRCSGWLKSKVSLTCSTFTQTSWLAFQRGEREREREREREVK